MKESRNVVRVLCLCAPRATPTQRKHGKSTTTSLCAHCRLCAALFNTKSTFTSAVKRLLIITCIVCSAKKIHFFFLYLVVVVVPSIEQNSCSWVKAKCLEKCGRYSTQFWSNKANPVPEKRNMCLKDSSCHSAKAIFRWFFGGQSTRNSDRTGASESNLSCVRRTIKKVKSKKKLCNSIFLSFFWGTKNQILINFVI